MSISLGFNTSHNFNGSEELLQLVIVLDTV